MLGAIECLRGGITTIQNLVTLSPFSDEHLDAILQAYEDVGIRSIIALQVADIPGARMVPFGTRWFRKTNDISCPARQNP